MDDAHRLLGLVAIPLAVTLAAAAAWSAKIARRTAGRRDRRFLVDRLAIICVVLVSLAGLAGLTEAVTGPGPAEELHAVYGVVAALTLPFAMALGVRAEKDASIRRRDRWIALGALLMAVLGLRLWMTG